MCITYIVIWSNKTASGGEIQRPNHRKDNITSVVASLWRNSSSAKTTATTTCTLSTHQPLTDCAGFSCFWPTLFDSWTVRFRLPRSVGRIGNSYPQHMCLILPTYGNLKFWHKLSKFRSCGSTTKPTVLLSQGGCSRKNPHPRTPWIMCGEFRAWDVSNLPETGRAHFKASSVHN